jgi:hypothetical protein
LDGGQGLEISQTIETPAPVRHFFRQNDTLWIGMNSSSCPLVQKDIKVGDHEWESQGAANVGLVVGCIVAVEEETIQQHLCSRIKIHTNE